MRLIRTEKQKDNLAKFFWDMAKVVLTVLVITPFARPETRSLLPMVSGLISGAFLAVAGYLIDGREVQK